MPIPVDLLPDPQEAEDGSQLDKEADMQMEVFGSFLMVAINKDEDADVDETLHF